MSPQRHEIYLIRWRLRESFDFRPCVVLADSLHTDTCIILVSSSDLYRPKLDFLIPNDHPDFSVTGLKKTSFVVGDQIHEVPTQLLNTLIGRLSGNLEQEFIRWID